MARDWLQSRRLKAVQLIQRLFRRYRERKHHLQGVRQRTEKRFALAKEEEAEVERVAKRTEAAIKIQNAWRKHQTNKIKKLNLQMATTYAHSFGKIEVVQIEGIKKCCLC